MKKPKVLSTVGLAIIRVVGAWYLFTQLQYGTKMPGANITLVVIGVTIGVLALPTMYKYGKGE